MRYAAAVLAAGFPLPAYLQLLRVYGQVMAQIADAEVRLMHLYVHKPLMRAGVPDVEIAEEMEGMTREVLPFAAPFMNYLHGRLLSHFVEQDMIGHMEADLGDDGLEEGRLRVAIAFADLAGYARLTVERGDEAAVGAVERFVEAVAQKLPADARVIKTLGDEVMVIGSDPAALIGWAVGLQAADRSRASPPPRIGDALRRGALPRRRLLRPRGQPGGPRRRARGRRRGAGHARRRGHRRRDRRRSQFDRIGEVRLKGFSEPTELFRGRPPATAEEPRGRRRSVARGGAPRAACSPATAPWSRCSPAGATRPACSTSRSRCSARRRDRAARQLRPARGAPTGTSATAAALCCAAARRRPRGGIAPRDAAAGGARQPAGLGAGAALRARRRAAGAGRRDALIAAGHTASDQVETILYRLAASPGRRALLGMARRRGPADPPAARRSRASRPPPTAAARGLRWREDASNEDERFARTRVRHGLLPALRAVHPAAEANVLRTAALLREETELLDGLVDAELAGAAAIALARLREMPARARAAGRRAARRAGRRAPTCRRPASASRSCSRSAAAAARAELHVGGSAGAVIEDGGAADGAAAAARARRRRRTGTRLRGVATPARALQASPGLGRGARQRRGTAAPCGRARRARSRATTPGARCCWWASSRAPSSS